MREKTRLILCDEGRAGRARGQEKGTRGEGRHPGLLEKKETGHEIYLGKEDSEAMKAGNCRP